MSDFDYFGNIITDRSINGARDRLRAAEASQEPQEVGYDEGEYCNRTGDYCGGEACNGIIIIPPVENCSCHLNPPCRACQENPFKCSECDYTSEEE